MNIVRYEPWNLFGRFQDDVSRLLGESFPAVGVARDRAGSPARDWAPAVDVVEEADRYIVTADLPGVDPKEIEITVADGVLTIKGVRAAEARGEDRDGYQRVERVQGSFLRRFRLPDVVDGDKASAATKDGVLEVTIPKHKKAQPHRIAVH